MADALKWLETSPKAPHADNGPSVAAPELLRTPRLKAFMKAEKVRDKDAENGKTGK